MITYQLGRINLQVTTVFLHKSWTYKTEIYVAYLDTVYASLNSSTL